MAVYVETRSKQGITSIVNKTTLLTDDAQAAKQEEYDERTKLGALQAIKDNFVLIFSQQTSFVR